MMQPRQSAHAIARWLASQLTADGFPARTFYGESFALWLWQQYTDEFSTEIKKIKPFALAQLNRQDTQSHPEFNLYALWHYAQLAHIPPQELIPNPPSLRRTPNTNWLLLGNLTQYLWKQANPTTMRWLTRLLLACQQQSDGLLRDDRLLSAKLPLPFPWGKNGRFRLQYRPDLRSLSLQYHAFSLTLLWQLYAHTHWPEIKQAAAKGTAAIHHYILANGDTLYLGRGQQQIFGYAALLTALSQDIQHTQNPNSRQAYDLVWQYVATFQRQDGSFPLVLRYGESGFPHTVDTADTRWLGWYSYNNLFDYLPFLGVHLAHLPDAKPATHQGVPPRFHAASKTAVWHYPHWQGTITAPQHNLSEDQPLPYLVMQNQLILPCFGGEIHKQGTYQLTALPLPYFQDQTGNYHFLRQTMKWQLKTDQTKRISLIGACAWGQFKRTYQPAETKIIIYDELVLYNSCPLPPKTTLFPLVITALHLESAATSNHYYLKSDSSGPYLTLEGTTDNFETIPGFTPSGPVTVLRERMSTLPAANQMLKRTLTIYLPRLAS